MIGSLAPVAGDPPYACPRIGCLRAGGMLVPMGMVLSCMESPCLMPRLAAPAVLVCLACGRKM